MKNAEHAVPEFNMNLLFNGRLRYSLLDSARKYHCHCCKSNKCDGYNISVNIDISPFVSERTDDYGQNNCNDCVEKVRELNGITADKDSFLQIRADASCAYFKVIGKAENIVSSKKKIGNPYSCCNIGDIVNRQPADEDNHYTFGDNIAVKRIFISSVFREQDFTPENVSCADPARIKEVSSEGFKTGGGVHSLKPVEICNESA